jgi:hypothetical protein
MVDFKSPNVRELGNAVSSAIVACAEDDKLLETVMKCTVQEVVYESCPGYG